MVLSEKISKDHKKKGCWNWKIICLTIILRRRGMRDVRYFATMSYHFGPLQANWKIHVQAAKIYHFSPSQIILIPKEWHPSYRFNFFVSEPNIKKEVMKGLTNTNGVLRGEFLNKQLQQMWDLLHIIGVGIKISKGTNLKYPQNHIEYIVFQEQGRAWWCVWFW